jgi:hypothetical protein
MKRARQALARYWLWRPFEARLAPFQETRTRRFVFSCILTPADIGPKFPDAAPVQAAAFLLPASQAPASDHVVGTTCGRRGRDVRRFTIGEENDATGHKALTLLNRQGHGAT